MADKPKSTADILAAIRNKGGDSPSPAESVPSPAAAPPAESKPAASAKPAGDTPKGTSSILASIRSGGGAAAAPKADAPKPAAVSGGEAPKGTSGILASIRGGGAAKPGAAPAAAKPAAKAAPSEPQGDRPSVQEMIKAVKQGVKVPEPGQPKMPARLPTGKPVAAKLAKTAPRRSVFAPILALVATPFALAWTLMTFIAGVFTLKGAQFMMPNMVLELPSRFKVGVPSDFPLGSVSEKYKAARGIWIVHTDAYDGRNTIYALASVCTHLGCTPSWLQGEQKFKCPCHGSGFYISGVNFEGPAPRPLERVGIRMSEDGQIEVDKSVKFQEELGQWADAKSFIEMV
ncbi:MAG: ubiquinol-cytochrome c reductase iron-sulfur subunit [Planctomycetaceae bacterium]